MTPLTPDQLTAMAARAERARALAEAATKGPWMIDPLSGGIFQAELCRDIGMCYDADSGDDTVFVAAARSDVPALADDVETLLTERERLAARVAELESEYVGTWADMPLQKLVVIHALVKQRLNAINDEINRRDDEMVPGAQLDVYVSE